MKPDRDVKHFIRKPTKVGSPNIYMVNGKVIIVMPAYNAGRTLTKTLADIPSECRQEIILVDDGSTDDTAQVAKELSIECIVRHERNVGYGGNQKTCYREALRRGADYVVMIHPDYQYDGRMTPFMLGILETGVCDIVLGSRIRTRREALEGGMPLYKYLSNRILTTIENLALGQNLGDFHSGMRAYRREVLESIPFEKLSNDFVFDTQFLVEAVRRGFKIGDIPVPVRYHSEASSINLRRSIVYGWGTLAAVARYLLKMPIVKDG
ncbi:MAG: glycosyltransferase family 2 protein [Calditrichota bacterium]